MSKLALIIFIIAISNIITAEIINVPDDQSTIQAAINSAVDNDTILVQPGTYVENINYNGKNIVIGSLFLTTSDETYISQTIIDGDHSDAVVTFDSGESGDAVLCGFKLVNGSGGGPDIYSKGGGIGCKNNSNPTLKYLIITNNTSTYGAGIFCLTSDPSIDNVEIFDNNAFDHWE